MIPGECVEDVTTACTECNEKLDIGVYQSNAGYYIGFWCPNCGPYSRESRYYRNEVEASVDLQLGWVHRKDIPSENY